MFHVLLELEDLVEEFVFVWSFRIGVFEGGLCLFDYCVLEELNRFDDVNSVL